MELFNCTYGYGKKKKNCNCVRGILLGKDNCYYAILKVYKSKKFDFL